MTLKELLTPELTVCHAQSAQTKKQVLSLISDMIADADCRLKAKHILQALLEREQLGSTAIGHGFAIPHARIDNLKKAICVLISLDAPISFDNDDDTKTTDIIFGLLVPKEATEEHLQALSRIATSIKSPHYREQLRLAHTNETLHQAAISEQGL